MGKYLEGDDEDLFTDDGSVNMEDVHDVMFFHHPSSSVLDGSQQIDKKNMNATEPKIISPKTNKKKCKAMPIRGRRLKTVPSSKGRFSVDVKQSSHKSSSF